MEFCAGFKMKFPKIKIYQRYKRLKKKKKKAKKKLSKYVFKLWKTKKNTVTFSLFNQELSTLIVLSN